MRERERNEELLKELVQALAARASQRTAALCAEDAVLHCAGRHALAGTRRGRAEVLRFFEQEQATAGERPEYEAILANDEHGVLIQRFRGKKDARPLNISLAIVFRFRAGKIAEARVHTDDQRALEELWS